MDCQQVQSKLTAYTDGQLNESERDRIRRHLSACAACSEELDRFTSLNRVLDEATVPPAPPHLAVRIREAAERRTAGRAKLTVLALLLSRPIMRRAAGFAAVGIGLLLGGFMGRDITPSARAVTRPEQQADLDVLVDSLGAVPEGSLVAGYLSLNEGID